LAHLLFNNFNRLPLIARPFFHQFSRSFLKKIFWAVIQLSSCLLVGPALVLLPTSSTHTPLFGPFAVQRLQSAAPDCSPIPFSILSLFFECNFWAVIQSSSRLLVGPALVLLQTSSTHTPLLAPIAVSQSYSAASVCLPIPLSILSLFFEKNFWAVIQSSSRLFVGPALVALPTSLSICCSTTQSIYLLISVLPCPLPIPPSLRSSQ
jgi:hypothetical protein